MLTQELQPVIGQFEQPPEVVTPKPVLQTEHCEIPEQVIQFGMLQGEQRSLASMKYPAELLQSMQRKVELLYGREVL